MHLYFYYSVHTILISEYVHRSFGKLTLLSLVAQITGEAATMTRLMKPIFSPKILTLTNFI